MRQGKTIKGKAARRLEEQGYRSDSDVDFDFAAERKRCMETLPIPKLVWGHIFPEGGCGEEKELPDNSAAPEPEPKPVLEQG